MYYIRTGIDYAVPFATVNQCHARNEMDDSA